MMAQSFLDVKVADAFRREPAGTAIALNLLVGAAYLLTGIAGLKLAFVGQVVTLFWPPSGIAFAAIWLCGFRLLPAIGLGAFAVNLVAFGSIPLGLLVAVGNMLPAIASTIMLRGTIVRRARAAAAAVPPTGITGWRGEAEPGEVARVLLFILIAVLGSTWLSATVGTLAVATSGQAGASLLSTWLVWWMGDAMGVMIAAPPILLWQRVSDSRWSRRTLLASLAFTLAGVGAIAALVQVRDPVWAVELCKLLPLFLSLAAGIRFGLGGTAAMTLLMALGCVGVTVMGVGPFARASFYDSFALLHSFLFAVAIAGMLLAAALADLRRTVVAERQARGEADAASANRIRLLTMISHDVRTPLSGMTGALEALRQSPLAPEQRRLAELGLRAGSTLTTLIADILDVARVDAGRITLQIARFDPGQSLADIVAIHRDAATAAGLALAVDGLATLPPQVHGDRARFEQVFGNLVANAIAYTAAGEVRLVADWQADDGPLRVEVIDTGPGLAPEQAATMFKAFAQIPRSGPRSGPPSTGLGLGLPICHALVELMGGQISYQAAAGGGSVFRVALPLAAAVVSAPENDRTPDPSQRILLVEDDAITREVTKAMLEARGHRVSVAAAAAAAVAMAAEAQFDLVLLDLNLGLAEARDNDPTGFRTARQIRSLPGPAGQVTLVALTADAVAASAQACRAAGIDAVIIKPLALAEGLKAAIDAGRTQRPTPARDSR